MIQREPSPFDIAEGPLEGVHLIEAGAGTGKTYALTTLFIRLILGKGLTAAEVLVVTYTVAATKELRGKIRRKLREALDAFTGKHEGDTFIRGLVKKHEKAQAVRLLEEALHDFDLAPIFTIHGFCQRTLREHAFESGATFDTELLADDARLRAEVLDDFWRTRFYDSNPDFFRYAKKSCGLKQFRGLLAKGTAHPRIAIVPDSGPVELSPLGPVRELFNGLRDEWEASRESIVKALSSEALNKKTYGGREKLAAGMEAYLCSGIMFPVFKELRKFTPPQLEKGTKKGTTCPRHPFFDLCGRFYESTTAIEAEMDRKILSLKADLFRYFRTEFSRRKQALNIQSFEDLMARMEHALQGPQGDALAAALRRRYRVALIDEFQDTDPVQYFIFSRIFGADKAGALFLIGDPKQAIYGFRGADLFTYLHASSEVAARHTLLTNRRSEPKLIEAVNTIFERAHNPFLFKEIEFRRAGSEPPDDLEFLSIGGRQEAPFHLWFVKGGEKAVAKGTARKLIAGAVAAEISRLVGLGRAGSAMLGGRPLKEADIAVLVRKHSEARIVQGALRALGIMSVLYSDADLFASDEAIDLERVLRAVAQPASESAFRTALATDFIGLTAEPLESLLADNRQKEDRLARFRRWRETWERSGFLFTFRQLLKEERVRERLLLRPDGERRLTNYLHLGEVLHREAADRKLGMSSLVDWLELQRSEESRQAPEERQLRLESDAETVKVITIHMSKGLEFPIVFCPFNWDGRMEKKDGLLYHDREDRWKLNLALTSPGQQAEALADMEVLAENIRLLYVALTRAKNRCYMVWGGIAESSTSAAAYILHPVKSEPEKIVKDLEEYVKGLSSAEMRAQIDPLQAASSGAIAVYGIPAGAGDILPSADTAFGTSVVRDFRSAVERDWGISSFSALAGSSPARIEHPDYDSAPGHIESEGRSPGNTITDFPRGALAGTFFHKLFEEMDFRDPPALEEYVGNKLAEHGYGTEWKPAVFSMTRNVLAADLDGKGLNLSGVGQSERLNELGFYIPLKHISPESLSRTFGRFAGGAFADIFPRRLENLEFAPCRGFMCGFVDLVFRAEGRFYLVDWKSNFLGHRPEDYSGNKITASMQEHLYFLQYHLYCLALNRYLQKRLPEYSYENHFGGVFYIYLRGFGETGKSAIFRDRPEKALIEALDEALIRAEGNGERNG